MWILCFVYAVCQSSRGSIGDFPVSKGSLFLGPTRFSKGQRKVKSSELREVSGDSFFLIPVYKDTPGPDFYRLAACLILCSSLDPPCVREAKAIIRRQASWFFLCACVFLRPLHIRYVMAVSVSLLMKIMWCNVRLAPLVFFSPQIL